jgi:protein-S-isoprenylcysteine O-methyltransferase Ste14
MHPAIVKRLAGLIFSLAITALCLFGSSGRIDWLNAWVLLGLSCATGVATTAALWRTPELAAERTSAKPAKNWDKVLVSIAVLLGPMSTWIIAGLEFRLHWSNAMPAVAFGAGIAVAVLGAALLAWAMKSNEFFSSVVRIQKERGHTVVAGGPYRFIRHPGYAGMMAFTLATPLILNSRWAFVPAVAAVAATAFRTVLEDRTLQNELEGYADYARRVKYKLIPGIW